MTILGTQSVPSTNETDLRIRILNSFLSTPHRKLEEVVPIHATMVQQDPLFYRQLAAWYGRKGEIRDHQEAFIISLLLDKFEGNRDIGAAMLRELPPFRVIRVVDYIIGTTIKTPVYDIVAYKAYGKQVKAVRDPILKEAGITIPKAVKDPNAKKGKNGKPVKAKRVKFKLPADIRVKIAEGIKDIPKPKPTYRVDRKGLFKNAPRILVTEITRYLREREADIEWFDAAVLSARKHMRRLYSQFHIKPSDRARKILFENAMPEGSRLAALRELSQLTDPIEQARSIIKNRIPYKSAATVVAEMTPTVILALVEVMSSQELINNLGSLKARGAFDNSDIRAAIDDKLVQAKKSKKVSAFKGNEAIKAADLDEGTQAALKEVANSQIQSKGRLKHRVALLIDKSQSMHVSIEIGKQIGAMISAIAENDFYCFAFDNMPYPIKPPGSKLADWEKALAGIKAGGQTGCGVALEYMRRSGAGKPVQVVDQIIIVTDGGENQNPTFSTAYNTYCKTTGVTPSVVVVKVSGDYDRMTPAVRAAGIEMDVWEFKGDYYSLPSLIPLLTKSTKLDLLMEIMSFPLPERKLA